MVSRSCRATSSEPSKTTTSEACRNTRTWWPTNRIGPASAPAPAPAQSDCGENGPLHLRRRPSHGPLPGPGGSRQHPIRVRTARNPSFVLHPGASESEHLADCGSQIVVTDLAGRDPAQHAEGMQVAFEKRLLPAGGEHPVDRLAGVRHPEREQKTAGPLDPQQHIHVAEVDLGLDPGPVRRRDEHPGRSPARRHPDLRAPQPHAVTHRGAGDALHLVLRHQPVEDLPHRMALLERRVQIHPKHRVNRRFAGNQAREPRVIVKTCGWPLAGCPDDGNRDRRGLTCGGSFLAAAAVALAVIEIGSAAARGQS